VSVAQIANKCSSFPLSYQNEREPSDFVATTLDSRFSGNDGSRLRGNDGFPACAGMTALPKGFAEW
jgi:hypothetical protein